MEFDEWREPIEFFLLGLDEHFPEDVSMAMCCMWTQVDIIDNDILNKVQDKKFGKVDPDFFDENERPRLRLSTIARITGIPQRLLEDSRIADFGSDKFRDAADFIRLTREKYSEADGKMREMYLRAWNDFYEESPKELKQQCEEKFKEIFGDPLAGISPIGTDETGSNVYTSADVAKALGMTEDDVIKSFEEYEQLGINVGFSMPEPEKGKIN
ncbi:hypothetical protein [Desulfovibrio falkowii]|uniref:Uncharacterized protein n=1 Tax=Desulfovibrio falkowii TaxID=3136602 RepID=A0ABQ0E8U9_9BACT